MNLWHVQGLRFLAVGLISNLVLFIAYLALTTLGIGHKSAMTLLYVIGTAQTFVFNKRWTFSHRGRVVRSLVRYFFAYGCCYVLNLAALVAFVDRFGWPHAPVQGAAVLMIGATLFLTQKFWVFQGGGAPVAREQAHSGRSPFTATGRPVPPR